MAEDNDALDEDEDDEEEEGEEGEGEEGAPQRAPRKGRRLLPLLAILVAVVVVGAVAAYFITANRIPTASFSYASTDLHLSVTAANSTDPDGDALNFSWSWGDNAAGGYGITESHNYAAQGTY